MSAVFADTFYWAALANPRDQWHQPVLQARARLGAIQIVTTEEVLTEFLTAMSGEAGICGELPRSWHIPS
jgi:uncharacterized protein